MFKQGALEDGIIFRTGVTTIEYTKFLFKKKSNSRLLLLREHTRPVHSTDMQ